MGILQCKSIFYYRYNLFTVEKLFLLKHFVLLCLFTSQTSPASCAIITLSADMFVCWQNALLCHSWNKLPLSVQALPYGPVWNRRFMYFSTGKQKQTASQSSKAQVSTCQTHLDHCGCLTCFKRQTLVQIENNKWFKLLLCWTDRHTVPVVTWLSCTGNGEQYSQCHCGGTQGPHSSVVTAPALFLGKEDNLLTWPCEVWWLNSVGDCTSPNLFFSLQGPNFCLHLCGYQHYRHK